MTDLEFLCDLAERCGALASAATRSMSKEYKADQSLVTNIDRAVEERLRGEISERFPSDAFYGEELGGDPFAADRLWVIDPIDGTTNMVHGLPCWGVSVGLVVGGCPAYGAFFLPSTQELFWFENGKGAFRNGERLQVKDRGPLHQEDTIGIGSEAIFILELLGFNSRQRNLGSLAAHFCYTASGALRANISVQERLHDLGAAYGVAVEAGCSVEYLDGGEAPLSHWLTSPTNLRPLMVGPPATLERLRRVIRERPSGIDTLGE